MLTVAALLLYNDVERQKAAEFVHRMVKRAVEMEGTVTVSFQNQPLVSRTARTHTRLQGEHGVGLVKRDYLPHELGEDTVDMMRKVRI